MNEFVLLQFGFGFVAVRYGVQDDERCGSVDADVGVALVSEHEVRQEVHEAFKDAYMLVLDVGFLDGGDVFGEYAALEIGVAQFVTADIVWEGDGEVGLSDRKSVV